MNSKEFFASYFIEEQNQYSSNILRNNFEYIRANFSHIYDELMASTMFCEDDIKPSERIYLFVNDIKAIPRCYCGNKLTFRSNRYSEYCSIRCSSNSDKKKADIANTNKQKYGVKCNLQLIEKRPAKERYTLCKDHGVSHYMQIPEKRAKALEKRRQNYLNTLPDEVKTKESLINLLETHGTVERVQTITGVIRDTIFRLIDEFGIEYKPKLSYRGQEDALYKSIKSVYNDKIERNKRCLEGQEIDIFLPDINIGFEYNGNYWHSSGYKETTYHQTKSLLAIENNIRLFHVYEFEQDKTIQYIIEHLLHKKNMIYGRKCDIRHVNKEQEREFLDKYHLQGYVASSICLGLYYDDELISLMSFGTSRFDDRYEFELIRYCIKFGYGIHGGKERLFNYFVKTYEPQSIISYSSLDYFNGEIYEKLGFKNNGLTKPSYLYVNRQNRVASRYQVQKHRLHKFLKQVDMNLTEEQNMLYSGYMKIYKAGHQRFIWNE